MHLNECGSHGQRNMLLCYNDKRSYGSCDGINVDTATFATSIAFSDEEKTRRKVTIAKEQDVMRRIQSKYDTIFDGYLRCYDGVRYLIVLLWVAISLRG